jgi:hypothetical protein
MFHEILKNWFRNTHGWKFVKMWDQMNFASSIKVETYCKQMQNFMCMPLGYYGPTHNSKTLEYGKVVGTSGVWCSIRWRWGLIGPIPVHNWHLGHAPQHVTDLGVLFCHFFRFIFVCGKSNYLLVPLWVWSVSLCNVNRTWINGPKKAGKRALHSRTGPVELVTV